MKTVQRYLDKKSVMVSEILSLPGLDVNLR